MAEQRITFEISEETADQAALVAAEMGLPVETLAKTAFEAYLDGVREAMSWDLDQLEG